MPLLADARPVVMICTKDRAAALPFYRDTLGLRLVSEDPFAAVFEIAGATMRLSDVADWKPHPHTIFGFTVDDIAKTVEELAGKGVAFLRYPGFEQDKRGVWTSPDGAARIAWFNDPDGNNLSLAQLGK